MLPWGPTDLEQLNVLDPFPVIVSVIPFGVITKNPSGSSSATTKQWKLFHWVGFTVKAKTYSSFKWLGLQKRFLIRIPLRGNARNCAQLFLNCRELFGCSQLRPSKIPLCWKWGFQSCCAQFHATVLELCAIVRNCVELWGVYRACNCAQVKSTCFWNT